MERLVANAPMYLEPWQREPVDPTVEHIVTLERRGEFPRDQMRASCSCGLDRGWGSSLAAEQDADFHRTHVRDTKVERGLDSLPIPLIERKNTEAGASFRWTCHCAHTGPWLVSEAVAALCSMLHTQDCDERRERADVTPLKRRRRP
jgi:hypothetical protein